MDPPACILVFESIHQVLAAEQSLKEGGFWCDLLPAPREISSDCGMVVAVKPDDCERARAALAAAFRSPRAWYRFASGRLVT